MPKLQHVLIGVFILSIIVLVDIGVIVVYSGKITTVGARLFAIFFIINVILNIIIVVNLNNMVNDLKSKVDWIEKQR